MSIRTTSKSALFLMELIIAILFFSVASAVCIRLFVQSHLVSQNTVNTNQSILISQNIAEAFSSTESDIASLSTLLNATPISEHDLEIYYDNNWSPCEKPDATYIASVMFYEDNGLHYIDIDVHDNKNHSFYTLSVSNYIQKTS